MFLRALPVMILVVELSSAGQVRVVDGDTIELSGERIRLIGLDAPEGNQECQRDGKPWRCGDDAEAALVALIDGQAVSCDILGRDRFGRPLAVCFAGTVELNREIVRTGWALAWYPKGGVRGPQYDAEETEASAAGRGLWSGSFIPPWEWRR